MDEFRGIRPREACQAPNRGGRTHKSAPADPGTRPNPKIIQTYGQNRLLGRVGGWRAGFMLRWRFRRFCPGPQSGSVGRVSSPPFIKPDMRISRIRLSDEIIPSPTEGPWSSAHDG